ncbi:unnamed protein product [Amoebophrya sp. A120]|nr:unnamed protein product [Amoebophrya sp. A120]|eukprot:GSA120T00009802001.1
MQKRIKGKLRLMLLLPICFNSSTFSFTVMSELFIVLCFLSMQAVFHLRASLVTFVPLQRLFYRVLLQPVRKEQPQSPTQFVIGHCS